MTHNVLSYDPVKTVFGTLPERGGLGAITLALALAASSPALAQGGRVLPVDEMARNADVVGVATVDSALAHADSRTGFIYTDFHLTFSEVWKGDAGSNFILMKPGGEVGGRHASVPGHEYVMKPGEKVVVFATPSSLGNHVVIGLRQGLYRVGPGADPLLFRVSEFPFGLGKESPLTLQVLRDQVSAALGKPTESKPGVAPTETRPAPAAPAMPAPTTPESRPVPPIPPPAPQEPAAEGPRWIGAAVIIGILVLVGFGIRQRKTQPPG